MSRIAGIYSPKGGSHDCVSMLKSVKTDENWSLNIEENEFCALGSIAKNNDNFSSNGISIAIDGIVYNRSVIDKKNSIGVSILNLYRKYGFEGTIQRLNGDFAIALYDSNDQALWIARDRV